MNGVEFAVYIIATILAGMIVAMIQLSRRIGRLEGKLAMEARLNSIEKKMSWIEIKEKEEKRMNELLEKKRKILSTPKGHKEKKKWI